MLVATQCPQPLSYGMVIWYCEAHATDTHRHFFGGQHSLGSSEEAPSNQ